MKEASNVLGMCVVCLELIYGHELGGKQRTEQGKAQNLSTRGWRRTERVFNSTRLLKSCASVIARNGI